MGRLATNELSVERILLHAARLVMSGEGVKRVYAIVPYVVEAYRTRPQMRAAMADLREDVCVQELNPYPIGYANVETKLLSILKQFNYQGELINNASETRN